jgi:predicted transcriptional regulator
MTISPDEDGMDTSLDIDPKLEARIRELAERQKTSADELVVKALEDYVSRAEWNESFLQEALESLRDYEETGLHITGDELFAWLDTWGTDPESEPPACHT